ncbi:MAG: sensor histidine kinase, partial [Acidimicrobiales bacterium]
PWGTGNGAAPATTDEHGNAGFPAGPGRSGGWAVLEVADRGPGMTPEQADRAFERFWRGDPSRARGPQSPGAVGTGAGLGLSIVAAIAAAHGGRVDLETAPGEGATFRVVLPAAGPLTGPAGGGVAGGSVHPPGAQLPS